MRTLVVILGANVLILIGLVMFTTVPPVDTPDAVDQPAAPTPAPALAPAPEADSVAAAAQLPPAVAAVDIDEARQRAQANLVDPLTDIFKRNRPRHEVFSRAYVPNRERVPEVSIEVSPVQSPGRVTGTLRITHSSGRFNEEIAVVITASEILVGPDSMPATDWLAARDELTLFRRD
ncbi:MAG: hypothetical protein AB7K09_19315 [Planctomycetota bacterium]